ncbi:lantibiotic dehydratase [Actinosynnema mirum]|uniref:Lantibiotic dehydratase domain protein n=1 Tax=Actinosynnema mirum (strain ATCC 29888 / DSM 43827 / JCM 3225 / NBRC 14064 / NCIMB 13271 / NRRL B-12336 / IMRU 3971 / 101) TaxID=446462 RepID=C6WBQ6_ACTMD|nr:lantibiotic dehydratase [Actinosynnema mirum]ACU37473.1 Lantibiotic dehydratase domain protein [Actinosynnema mirum DSM 43827]
MATDNTTPDSGRSLPGGRWRLWDQFSVRGAGFPVDGVLRLAPHGLGLAADRFASARSRQGAEWKAFEAAFEAEAVKSALELRDIAGGEAFQSAIAWQNRAVLGRAVRPFLEWEPGAGRASRTRQREELISHYWQRFCVKNDTIGFFGPVGWGRLDDAVDGVEVDPGEGLVASTSVHFASWAVDALARVLGEDPALAPWIAPRRVPFVRLGDGEVALPGCAPKPLAAPLLEVLARCDGTRAAIELSGLLGRDVTADLVELERRRCLVRRLEVPAGAHPERALRAWLEGVPQELAAPGLAALDELERGRDRIASASTSDGLVEAMSALERRFEELTATAAAREKGGSTAPGRALAHSDCRRSATVRLGGRVLDGLAALEPLLVSAAWLTSSLARRVLDGARRVFDASGPVDLATFWFACMPVLHRDAGVALAELRAEFWRRWAEVLDLPEGAREVRLDLAKVSARARAAFASPGGGWNAARYLSPDVMIAAAGADAVRRGEFSLVLGELHVAMNTLGASLYLDQHPDASELVELTTRDVPGPRLLPLLPKEHKARLSSRVRQSLVRPEDYCVALVDDTADPRRPRTSRSADVRVELRGEELVAVLPDGAVFPVADVFSHVLTTLVVDGFRVLPEADRTPRVSVGPLVVSRETWRFPVAELDFADARTEPARFAAARAWRAERGLPRFVFFTSPAEPRPVFADFDSPASVTLLAKAVRRLARADGAARLTVVEMLPTPEQAWLTDDRGEVYTSELRFVLRDTAP